MKTKNIVIAFVVSFFSVSFMSCSDSEDIQAEKRENGISVEILESNTKSGDNDDDLLPDIPILKGKINYLDGTPVINSNIELQSLPDYLLVIKSLSDSKGNFTFYNVRKGSYRIVVKEKEEFLGELELSL